MPLTLSVSAESFPLREKFVISRGERTEAVVVTVRISDGKYTGRGECTPYPRYGESVEGVLADIRAFNKPLGAGAGRTELQRMMPAGAARNAIDCALWDLEAKRAGVRVWELAGLAAPYPVTSVFTISLGNPKEMGRAAALHSHRPLLKLKLSGPGDIERLRAVRRHAPEAVLVVDANEAWTLSMYKETVPELERLGVALLEQPFHAEDDDALRVLPRPIPVCADESCHTSSDIPDLLGKYDAFNIKLDKTGGLTEALRLARAGRSAGLTCMCGCMLASSLGLAPAHLVAQQALFVDLDAALNLAQDRNPPLRYEVSDVLPPARELWG